MMKKGKLSFSWIHYVITFFLMFFFRFLPPVGGITPVGMQVVGVWIGVLYGWVTLSISGRLFWASLRWV